MIFEDVDCGVGIVWRGLWWMLCVGIWLKFGFVVIYIVVVGDGILVLYFW